MRYDSSLDTTFQTEFRESWEGSFIVREVFDNGSYQLQDLDGTEDEWIQVEEVHFQDGVEPCLWQYFGFSCFFVFGPMRIYVQSFFP